MPIRINEVNGEQYLVVHVWGKLERADYEHFIPQFAELAGRSRRLRLLFEIKFDIRHANDFERVAAVGDNVWERVMAILIKPFAKGRTRYFDATQYTAAREWLREGCESGCREKRRT